MKERMSASTGSTRCAPRAYRDDTYAGGYRFVAAVNGGSTLHTRRSWDPTTARHDHVQFDAARLRHQGRRESHGRCKTAARRVKGGLALKARRGYARRRVKGGFNAVPTSRSAHQRVKRPRPAQHVTARQGWFAAAGVQRRVQGGSAMCLPHDRASRWSDATSTSRPAHDAALVATCKTRPAHGDTSKDDSTLRRRRGRRATARQGWCIHRRTTARRRVAPRSSHETAGARQRGKY